MRTQLQEDHSLLQNGELPRKKKKEREAQLGKFATGSLKGSIKQFGGGVLTEASDSGRNRCPSRGQEIRSKEGGTRPPRSRPLEEGTIHNPAVEAGYRSPLP